MPGYNPYQNNIMNRNYSNNEFNSLDARRDDHFISLKKKPGAPHLTEKKPAYGRQLHEVDDELER